MTAPKPGDVVVERRATIEHYERVAAAVRDYKPLDSVQIVELGELLATVEHNARPRWKPLLGVLAVDEGTTYLFAIETGDGWEYFSDSIGWDADEETVPSWHSGAHGWSLDAELFFAALPEPPKEPTK